MTDWLTPDERAAFMFSGRRKSGARTTLVHLDNANGAMSRLLDHAAEADRRIEALEAERDYFKGGSDAGLRGVETIAALRAQLAERDDMIRELADAILTYRDADKDCECWTEYGVSVCCDSCKEAALKDDPDACHPDEFYRYKHGVASGSLHKLAKEIRKSAKAVPTGTKPRRSQ